MQTFRKVSVLLAIFLFLLPSFAVGSAPEEATAAAKLGLVKFLQLIPDNMLAEYGFKSRTELQSCTLESPFQLHTILPKSLESYSQGATVESLLQNTGIWYFPIACNGQHKAMLVVVQIEGQWQAVSLGLVPLAKQLQNVQQAWSSQRGYHLVLVVVYQAREYLFHVPQVDAQNLTTIPFHQERESNFFNTQSLETVVPILRQKVQDNIRSQQPFDK